MEKCITFSAHNPEDECVTFESYVPDDECITFSAFVPEKDDPLDEDEEVPQEYVEKEYNNFSSFSSSVVFFKEIGAFRYVFVLATIAVVNGQRYKMALVRVPVDYDDLNERIISFLEPDWVADLSNIGNLSSVGDVNYPLLYLSEGTVYGMVGHGVAVHPLAFFKMDPDTLFIEDITSLWDFGVMTFSEARGKLITGVSSDVSAASSYYHVHPAYFAYSYDECADSTIACRWRWEPPEKRTLRQRDAMFSDPCGMLEPKKMTIYDFRNFYNANDRQFPEHPYICDNDRGKWVIYQPDGSHTRIAWHDDAMFSHFGEEIENTSVRGLNYQGGGVYSEQAVFYRHYRTVLAVYDDAVVTCRGIYKGKFDVDRVMHYHATGSGAYTHSFTRFAYGLFEDEEPSLWNPHSSSVNYVFHWKIERSGPFLLHLVQTDSSSLPSLSNIYEEKTVNVTWSGHLYRNIYIENSAYGEGSPSSSYYTTVPVVLSAQDVSEMLP